MTFAACVVLVGIQDRTTAVALRTKKPEPGTAQVAWGAGCLDCFMLAGDWIKWPGILTTTFHQFSNVYAVSAFTNQLAKLFCSASPSTMAAATGP